MILSTSNQRYLLEYFSMVLKDYLPVKGHFLSSSFPFFPLASPGTLHFSHQYLICLSTYLEFSTVQDKFRLVKAHQSAFISPYCSIREAHVIYIPNWENLGANGDLHWENEYKTGTAVGKQEHIITLYMENSGCFSLLLASVSTFVLWIMIYFPIRRFNVTLFGCYSKLSSVYLTQSTSYWSCFGRCHLPSFFPLMVLIISKAYPLNNCAPVCM